MENANNCYHKYRIGRSLFGTCLKCEKCGHSKFIKKRAKISDDHRVQIEQKLNELNRGVDDGRD